MIGVQPNTITSSTGDVAKVEYDDKGRVTKSFRSDGTSINYVYNQANGDLLSTTDTATHLSESKTYDDYGNVLTHVDPHGLPTIYNYHATTGLLTSVQQRNGQVVGYLYTDLGQPRSVSLNTDGEILTSTTTYYPEGLVQSTLAPDGVEQVFTYDNAGNALTAVTKKGVITFSNDVYTVDVLNRLRSVTTMGGKYA